MPVWTVAPTISSDGGVKILPPCMAAIFAVHGLSTPGVLQQGDRVIVFTEAADAPRVVNAL